MTEEEFEIYKGLPNSLKQMIEIGELSVNIYEYNLTHRYVESNTISSMGANSNHATLDMTCRRDDLIRNFLKLPLSVRKAPKKKLYRKRKEL